MNQTERINNNKEAQRKELEALSAKIRCASPAIVQSVDLERQTCSALLAIQGKTEGQYNNMPLLVDVPIVYPKAGGYALTFPVKAGDECLIVFSDRCIDAWWQNGGALPPIDDRIHDLSDAIAIFGPTSQPKKLPSVSDNSVDLRNFDKTDFIKIDDDGNITIEHRKDLIIKTGANCNITIQGNSTINVSGDTVLNCPQTTINGMLTVNGLITGTQGMTVSGGSGNSITCEGTATFTGDVVAGGISLQNHTHTEQGDGAETSGAH